MKQVVECKRALMYNVSEDKIVAILHECYKPTLSDQDILCVLFSPHTMEWRYQGELWIKNSNIRLEIFYEYKEVETLLDKIKRWFK